MAGEKHILTPEETARYLRSRFVSAYRLALVRDRQVSFDPCRISTSQEACPVIRKLIQTYGQSDREQFCELLLNSKNDLIGLNIVSTGTVTSAQVSPREALKPAILASASAVIFAHNHPSGHIEPSPEDIHLTENLVKAFQLVDITVHEHIDSLCCIRTKTTKSGMPRKSFCRRKASRMVR